MNVDGAGLEQAGYSRALWIAAPRRLWLAPGGLRVVSEEDALRELAELVGDAEEEDA
jgi:hypothetical protein